MMARSRTRWASPSACARGYDAMRWLTLLLLLLSGAAPVSPAWAQPAGQRFVSIAFHDVADRVDELDVDAVTTRSDRKSTRLNSSHANISYAVFCLKKKKEQDAHDSGPLVTIHRPEFR